jgi:hypothetical protein
LFPHGRAIAWRVSSRGGFWGMRQQIMGKGRWTKIEGRVCQISIGGHGGLLEGVSFIHSEMR